MVPDFIALAAVVVVLFSSTYFFMASLPFLLVRLDIPEVSRLFRGLFNVYFWMIGVSGLVATTVFAASGRLAFAAAMLSLAVTAIALGSWVLRSIDRQQTASQSGNAAARRRLRLIHWGGMLANAGVLASVAMSVPLLV
jgi:hypothetical protein